MKNGKEQQTNVIYSNNTRISFPLCNEEHTWHVTRLVGFFLIYLVRKCVLHSTWYSVKRLPEFLFPR